jgi:MFS family permease
LKIESLRFQVGLIALMQALLLTNNVTLIAINGLAGAKLASDPTFATLPVTGYVLGAALSSMAASRLMRLRGRRAGYTVGSLFAIVGTLLAGYAVSERNLPLLVAATFVVGVYNAFGASLRFAAADAADAWRPSFRARAISLVLAAGIVGGVVGPEVSKLTREALPTSRCRCSRCCRSGSRSCCGCPSRRPAPRRVRRGRCARSSRSRSPGSRCWSPRCRTA